MKFNFKKIGSILASGIMLAGTIGFAAAASYPEPFVTTGTAEGAIVVGANAATTDWAAAIDVQTKLNALVSSGTGKARATGGDSFQIEKPSTKFHLGRGIKDVISVAISEDNMPILLADGKFIDDDNDEFDYSQEIKLANSSLAMFDDSDYAEDTPTLGFRIANGKNVLNYTLSFNDEPKWEDLATSTLPIMGREYYILTTNYPTNTSLTLLDSAVDTVLAEGETATLEVSGKTYTISIGFISSTEVKLVVNTETTSSLAESETQKLSDGSYLGIKDIMHDSKDTGISKVEFSIGEGKLKLTEGQDLEVNDDTVSGLSANVSRASTLKRVVIRWDADGDLFITPDSEITLPNFESVKLSFSGMVYPAEEEIKIEADGSNSIMLKDFPLKDSVEDINLVWTNSSGAYNGTGKEADNKLRTPGGNMITTTPYGFNGTELWDNMTFVDETDDYFVASWNDSTSGESYLMRATNFKLVSGVQKCTFQYKKNGEWSDAKTDAKNGTSFSLGNAEIKVGDVDKTNKRVIITNNSAGTNFYTLYSKEGIRVILPTINRTHLTNQNFNNRNVTTAATPTFAQCAGNITSDADQWARGSLGTHIRGGNGSGWTTCDNFEETYQLLIDEEDKDGNLARGPTINVTLGETSSNSETTISDIVGEVPSFDEQGDTDVYRSFVYGALGSELLWDKSGSQYVLKIIYHGDESYGQVFISSPDTIITPGEGDASGQVLVVKDSEISSVSGKNLVVVGGSCINTVAAKILGSTTPICTSAFTEKTGVSAGQYIIKTVESPYNAEKVAMLVAGYEAADTVNAVAKAVEGVTSDKGTEQVYPIVAA